MNTRSSLGFEDDAATQTAKAEVLDLTDFKPRPVARPNKEDVAQAAEKSNFKSREVKPVTVAPAVPTKATRRRRTGRSAQLNLKVRPDTIEAFYAIADANGWVLGEAFERAVALLEQQTSKQ